MRQGSLAKMFAAFLFVICGFTAFFAQDSDTLVLNKEKSFTLKGKEEKTFYLNLKKGDFAEIFWKESLERFPDFSLFTPSGKNLTEEIYVSDSLPFVAHETGKYRLNVKFDSSDEESSKEAKISVSYSNVFNLPKSAKLKRQRKINGYDLTVYNSEDESNTYLLIQQSGKLKEILKGGSTVGGGFNFADDAALFDFPEGKKSAALFRSTLDKTGDGTPDAAIQFYSGGAHCCIYMHFFELGKDEIKNVKPIPGLDSDVLAIGKKPNGSLILKTGDSNFGYWLTSFAGSPIPTVILSFREGEFRPDFQLMKKPAPTPAVIKQKAAKAKKELDLKPYLGEEQSDMSFLNAFWGEMLDLMYSGNETAAWQYFDLVWDKRKAGKELFKQDFLKRLNQSRYWKMMQEDRVTGGK